MSSKIFQNPNVFWVFLVIVTVLLEGLTGFGVATC